MKYLRISLIAFLFISSVRGAALASHDKESATEWGWPLPYEQVSKKSLEWLKTKKWLPLTIGYFADVPGFSASYAIIKEKKLLEKRGLDVNFISFLSGPPIVESFLGGQTQVTHYGDFPFWLTFDKGALITAYALTGVNQEVALIVPPDSPIKKPEDIKSAGHQRIIGTTLGSYAEFYLTAMAENKGLARGDDFQLAGLSMREAQLVPKGVDAVALWDPHVTFCLQKNLGEKIDSGYPYFFATGFDFVRREIHENAPDVVQALADCAVEAILYARFNLEDSVDIFLKDPRVANYPRELIRGKIEKYLLSYPPTYRYVHKDFWVAEDSRIIKSLHAQKRINKAWSPEEMKKVFATEYMENTFRKLGWEIPERPVFLTPEWNGQVGKPPYPQYIVPENKRQGDNK